MSSTITSTAAPTLADCLVPANEVTPRRRPTVIRGWQTLVGGVDGPRWCERSGNCYVGRWVVAVITRKAEESHYSVTTTFCAIFGYAVPTERRAGLTLAQARRCAEELIAKVASEIAPGLVGAQQKATAESIASPVVVEASSPKAAKISHRSLRDVLSLIEEGVENVYLVGPAGSGKTSLAADLAGDLGREFGLLALSGGVTETHLLGRVLPKADGSWGYSPSEFVRIYETGGVFLLDEIDAADPNVLVAVNAALANGFLVDGEGKVRHRHAETIIIAAANTFGTGPDAQYVGRNPLDAATRDRFVLSMVEVDYDASLEVLIATGILAARLGEDAARSAKHLVEKTVEVRKAIAANRMRRVVSTRFIIRAAKAIAAGRGGREIFERLTAGWSETEVEKVRGVVFSDN